MAAERTESTSLSLLESARSAAPEAWYRLHQVYSPFVYRWCRKLGVGEHDATDLVQEVFHRVAVHLPQFRKQRRASFRSWIRTITINRVRDFYRLSELQPRATGGSTFRQQIEQVPSEFGTAQEQQEEDAQLSRQVLKLIQTEFEDSTWRAFWRTAVDAQPAKSIATELNMTIGAVRQAKYRVLRRLREELRALQ